MQRHLVPRRMTTGGHRHGRSPSSGADQGDLHQGFLSMALDLLRQGRGLLCLLQLLLLEHGLEIDFGQVHGWEACTRDQIRHVAT
jgi:hypothetical protein